MTVFENHGRWDTSNVELKDGAILRYRKAERNPRMRHIDYGLGVARASLFTVPAGREAFDLADIYSELSREGRLAAFEVHQRFYEIGSFEGRLELEALIRGENN